MQSILQYLAASHNWPRAANQTAVRWIDNNLKYPYRLSLSNKAEKKLRPYVQRTDKYYKATKSFDF